MYPIFIPSKGRSQTCYFCHNLKNTGREFYIFIYKEDLNDYLKYFDKNNLIIVPNTVNGITQKRQYMLNMARKSGLDWFWMVDDDINKFFTKPIYTSDSKRSLKELTIKQFLNNSEKFVKLLDNKNIKNVFQIGFKKSAFGLPESPITVNTDIGEIHMLNAKKLQNIDYDLNMVALEDTDLCVRNIMNKNYNIKLNHLIFYAPKSGTGKGGLEKVYKESGKSRGVKQFQKKYGKLIHINPDNSEKYRINWKSLKDDEFETKMKNIYNKNFTLSS